MLKIVLINPPQATAYSQPPMGLGLIAAILKREKYQVAIVDANAPKLKPEDIIPYAVDADVVGLTAMTPTINAAINIARHLKQANPNLIIILGGVHATLFPRETLDAAPEIDIIVRGEGEETIVELLRAMELNQPPADITGISYRSNGKIISTSDRPANLDLDSLPFLAYDLLSWQQIRPHPPHGRSLPFAAIITSRGCPYQCSFCSKITFGSKFRALSPQRVVEELAFYTERYGIREVAFYDDVFTLNKERAHAIADEIIKKELKICWTCETRVNLVDKELLQHLKRAGCYAIGYGIESASQEILDTLNKDITVEQAEEAIRLSREAGLQTIGYFMIGSPGESIETIVQTIQLAKKLSPDFAQFAVTTPLPGTRLYELYLDSIKNNDTPWENFIYAGTGNQVSPVFESNMVTRSDLQYWVRKAYKEFYLRPSYLCQRLRHTTSLGDLRVNIRGLSMLLGNMKHIPKSS